MGIIGKTSSIRVANRADQFKKHKNYPMVPEEILASGALFGGVRRTMRLTYLRGGGGEIIFPISERRVQGILQQVYCSRMHAGHLWIFVVPFPRFHFLLITWSVRDVYVSKCTDVSFRIVIIPSIVYVCTCRYLDFFIRCPLKKKLESRKQIPDHHWESAKSSSLLERVLVMLNSVLT